MHSVPFCMKKPGAVPPPSGMHCHCSTSQCSNSGNVAAGTGYDHVPGGLEHPKGGRTEMEWDPKGQSRGL